MAKKFTLDQIGRQIELLDKRLREQTLQVTGKQKPRTVEQFVKLQQQRDQYENKLAHLRGAYRRAVDEPLKRIGNQLMVNLMVSASQDELVELQRVLKKLNGVEDQSVNDQ